MGVNYNPYSLTGKTVLITGASSGIGRKTAIECSKLGAQVVLTGRNRDRLNETFTTLVTSGNYSFPADLTNQEEMMALIESMPVIDGLVLCAGQAKVKPFTFSTRTLFDEIFEINFFSQAELIRLMVKKNKIKKDASIVIVSSVGGVKDFTVGNTVYGTSKASLNALMKYCASELASKRIRVNSVNPGIIQSEMIKKETITEEQYKKDRERYPLKRFGETRDVALGIIYLLSDASSWVTGHSLVIDGGLTI